MIIIRKAHTGDVSVVAEMVTLLMSEFSGNKVDQENYRDTASVLLNKAEYFSAFLAFDEYKKCIGMITVTEICTIYAKGRFGVIQELYVLSEYRSMKVGHELIKKVLEYAKSRSWSRIEVGAPDRVVWARTMEFYLREGFIEIGPRLKLVFNGS